MTKSGNFPHHFGPNQSGAEFDCDSEDMKEEVEYMTDDEVVIEEQEESNHGNTKNIQHFEEKDDVDKWLNAEITKHMSIQGVENTKDALISIIKSIKMEMRDDIMKKKFEASTANIGNETSSITSNEVDTDYDNISPTASCLLPKELSPRSFILLFNIDDHNLYAITTLEAKDNIMPLDAYKYLGLDKLRDAGTVENTTGTNEPIRAIDILTWNMRRNGEDYGMWSTCDPDSKFCFGYNKVFGINAQGGLRMWICFRDHERGTVKGSYMGFADFLLEHLEQEQLPIRPRPCNYSFEEWLKIRIGHNNLHESDREFIFNEWILDSYDVEEEYAREIGDPYARRFDEYNRVFKNEIEHLSNEYILRIRKKGYVLDDKGDEALPLGRVNGARFKAMIRKELEGNKIQKLRGNSRDRLDSYSFGNFAEIAAVTVQPLQLRRNHYSYNVTYFKVTS
ncbi:hypothetical protein Tco_0613860 [Tanacetum coccineum]